MMRVSRARLSAGDAAVFARLRARVDASSRVVAERVADLVAAELGRRERRAVVAQRAAAAARLRGGPCFGCGQTVSGVWQDYAGESGTAAVRTELVGYWRMVGGRPLCGQCDELRGATHTVDDLRGAVAHALLPGDVGRWWLVPAVTGRVRGLRILWGESEPRPATRDREAPTAERFGWVDVSGIVAALAPPEVRTHPGPVCPRCGGSEYVPQSGGEMYDPQSRRNVVALPHERCACCGWVGRVEVEVVPAGGSGTTDLSWLAAARGEPFLPAG